jgi:hypothetical protein
MDDQEDFMDATLFGAEIPAALADEIGREPAEVLIIDYLLRSTLCEAERLGLPWFALVHMANCFYGTLRGDDEPWGWRWQYRRLNEIRTRLGLEVLPVGPEPWGIAMVRRSAGTLVAMPAEFDVWSTEPPATVHHLGPIFEEASPPDWQPPWDPEDERSLVVSLGSTYMHQEDASANRRCAFAARRASAGPQRARARPGRGRARRGDLGLLLRPPLRRPA